MLLRHRSSVDYSSEGASEAALSVESASRWNKNTTKCMNIKVVDVDVMFQNSKDLSDEAKNLIIPEWKDYEWLKNADMGQYSNKVKTLMLKILKVSASISDRTSFPEVLVDGFVSSLLNILSFDDYPCQLYPQYHYSANIGPHDRRIGATPDFCVTTENNFLLVIENKAVTSATYSNKWKENQVIGELFIAVHYIVSTSKKGIAYPVVVYAVRVIGTKFTFYKATATVEYIKETSTCGMSKNNKMEVQRYPPVKDDPSILTAYDICNKHDRMCILESLCSIRKLM